MAMTNNNGKSTGKIVYKTGSMNNIGKTATGTLNQEVFDANGKSVMLSTNKVKCDAGVLMIDIKSFMNNGSNRRQTYAVKGEDVYIEYPPSMSVGSFLPEGKVNMNVKNGDVVNEMEMSNRQVAAKESVTTPAGTWDCFKINYTMKITTNAAGLSIPIKMDMTEWFAPGFGVVKSVSKYGETKVVSIR